MPARGSVFDNNALRIQGFFSNMRISLLTCLTAALLASSLSTIAAESTAPFSMTGVADNSDSVELRFDGPSSKSAKLLIKGDRTGFPPKTVPCSYELEPVQRGALESPIVKITFKDKETMTIACDPLSDNCHADRYPTVAGTSFSMLWHIKRHQARSTRRVSLTSD
ncbi:hypothetical protein [Paraburkholderia azotifigens]|uniref:hypothetical protein n=1 Tax=Paraburkholderia azotifigens TaxID=2057004 RepID=UPI001EFFAB2B|nr:hypothetical protein [Paraburkholderia azotifigens]